MAFSPKDVLKRSDSGIGVPSTAITLKPLQMELCHCELWVFQQGDPGTVPTENVQNRLPNMVNLPGSPRTLGFVFLPNGLHRSKVLDVLSPVLDVGCFEATFTGDKNNCCSSLLKHIERNSLQISTTRPILGWLNRIRLARTCLCLAVVVENTSPSPCSQSRGARCHWRQCLASVHPNVARNQTERYLEPEEGLDRHGTFKTPCIHVCEGIEQTKP